MIKEPKQCKPGFPAARTQFLVHTRHFFEKFIILRYFAVKPCFILFYTKSGKSIDKLVDCKLFKLSTPHGSSTPASISASSPTWRLSSQSFPRKYSRGDRPPNRLFPLIYQPVISQCFNLGMRDEIVRPIDILFRVTLAVVRSLLHNMVNIVSFAGLSNIILKLSERLWLIEIGFDKWIFVVKPRGGFRRRFQCDDKLSLRSKSGARQLARQPSRGKLCKRIAQRLGKRVHRRNFWRLVERRPGIMADARCRRALPPSPPPPD